MTTADTSPPGRADVLLFALCLLPSLVVIWVVPYFPTQDGPNHLAIAHIIMDGATGDSPFAPYFQVSMQLRPHMLVYYLLVGLGHVVGLIAAERVVLTAVVVGLPLAAYFMVRRIAPDRWANVYLLIPLVTGSPFMMGFTTFLAGLIPAIAAIGFACGRAGDPSPRRRIAHTAIASALLILAGFAHPLAYAVGLLVIVAHELGDLRRREGWLRIAIIVSPVLLAGLGRGPVKAVPGMCEPTWRFWAHCPWPGVRLDHPGVERLWGYFVHHATLSSGELPLRVGALLVLVACAWPRTRPRAEGDARVRRCALVLLIVAALVPEDWGRNLQYLGHRVFFLFEIFLVLLAVQPAFLRAPRRRWVLALGASLPLALVQGHAIVRESRHIEQVLAIAPDIPRGSLLLPLNFDFRGTTGPMAMVQPLRHVTGYLVLDRDVLTPYLFAGGSPEFGRGGEYRPVRYKPGFITEWMPYISEVPAYVRREDPTLMTFVYTGQRYDRVLLIAPPEAIEELMDPYFTVEREHAGVKLLAPRP